MTEVTVRVESVRVDGRYRRDLGDLESLAASIKRDGLIHAITVTPDMRLLAGERRLAAYRLLGRETIEARVVDTLDDAVVRLRIERDENVERKPMTPEELVHLGKALEELERPRAAARKAQAPGLPRGEKLSHAQQNMSEGAGSTREIVASALGISASSYDRAKTVVEMANDASRAPEERAIAQEALADMNATGNISGNYAKVKKGTRTGAIRRPVIETASGQRRAIGSAEAALSGICHGLGQITEVHPEITNEEAARWVGSLSESRRIITALITRLKERTNAQP